MKKIKTLYDLYMKYYYEDKIVGFKINKLTIIFNRYHFGFNINEHSFIYYTEMKNFPIKKFKILKDK